MLFEWKIDVLQKIILYNYIDIIILVNTLLLIALYYLQDIIRQSTLKYESLEEFFLIT